MNVLEIFNVLSARHAGLSEEEMLKRGFTPVLFDDWRQAIHAEAENCQIQPYGVVPDFPLWKWFGDYSLHGKINATLDDRIAEYLMKPDLQPEKAAFADKKLVSPAFSRQCGL